MTSTKTADATVTPPTTAVRNEFAKMRRLRIAPLLTVMAAGIVALTCRELVSPGFLDVVTDPSGVAWNRLLAGFGFAVPLVSPILIAVIASRQVDLEHQGRGWLFSHAAGLPMGRLCRAKWISGAVLLGSTTLVQSGVVVGIGRLAGITAEIPAGRWLAYTTAVVVINLGLLALHVVLAAVVDNQLIGIGLGVVGVFIAASAPGLPVWAAHPTPWGYYALAAPVEYQGTELVTLTPSPFGVAALAVVVSAAFVLFTRRLDRQEV